MNGETGKERYGMKVAIVGAAGRMGIKLAEQAEAAGFEISARIDAKDGYDKTWPAGTGAVVDFSHHSAAPGISARAAASGAAYVIGSTGLDAAEQAAIEEAAKKIPVVQSANYSLGVNVLLGLVREAASILGPEYDVEITETHHRFKKDAPSGTALMLAKAVASGRGVELDAKAVYGRHGETGERPAGEIAIHALRAGSVAGVHNVLFGGLLESVEFTHRASDRAAFAAGAMKAAAWAVSAAPGLYSMLDVLGFSPSGAKR